MTELDYINEYFLDNIIKILKINLSDDSFEIIKADNNEINTNCGYNETSFSKWMLGLAENSIIHSDDSQTFLRHTDIDFLRRHFMLFDKVFRIRYHRKVNGEYRYVMLEIVAAKEYTDDNQIVVLSVHDVDNDIVEMLESIEREQVLTKLQEHYDAIKAIANIYACLYIINLDENSSIEYKATPSVSELASVSIKANEQMHNIISNSIIKDDLLAALKFTDITTLTDRLVNTDMIEAEFIGINLGWCRFVFIVNSRTIKGEIESVLFAVEDIDKQKRHEENLIRISNTDELTRVYNRRSYEADITSYKNMPSLENDFSIVLLDLNGLKTINDTLGHAAGDELITAAARCIISAIGHLGRVYRIGGDEFAAIIHTSDNDIAEIKAKLNETTAAWKGNFINSFSIAWGHASHKDYPDATLEELEQLADKAMYKDKSDYYIKNHIERRGQDSQ